MLQAKHLKCRYGTNAASGSTISSLESCTSLYNTVAMLVCLTLLYINIQKQAHAIRYHCSETC
jgi:hypothetical protein